MSLLDHLWFFFPKWLRGLMNTAGYPTNRSPLASRKGNSRETLTTSVDKSEQSRTKADEGRRCKSRREKKIREMVDEILAIVSSSSSSSSTTTTTTAVVALKKRRVSKSSRIDARTHHQPRSLIFICISTRISS